MVGSHPPLATDLTTVPSPRRPLDPGGPGDPVRRWYENDLGWPTVPASAPGSALRLRTGLRFDVLDMPLEAGRAALRHLADGSPVAVRGDRMHVLVAAGSAEELPGLLEWLEWGTLPLDLRARGAGGCIGAPLFVKAGDRDRAGALQGAAVWLRPPEPGCEVEASLPTMSALGGGGGAPDLVRVVDTAATHCHRLRLRSSRP
ncbi:SCO3374 family protein [Streptomyces sp. NPDC047072]|uniref:SCO3374 family protein n=1 Tax=Streptomyces sp. NPDC047072 TaxID=3154809 RepID=UPI0033BFC105